MAFASEWLATAKVMQKSKGDDVARDISPELLRKLLCYEPETGKLFWRERASDLFLTKRAASVWNARYAGQEALTCSLRGYKYGRLFNQSLAAHRAAWTIFHGEWPDHVDHINGCRHDNRISNLRSVDRTENNRNACRPKSNKSGVVGVCFDRTIKRWNARIGVNGKSKFLGNFDEKSSAIAARRAAEVQYGYHPNHGRAA